MILKYISGYAIFIRRKHDLLRNELLLRKAGVSSKENNLIPSAIKEEF